MPDLRRDLPHIHLAGGGQPESYTSPQSGRTPPLPVRDQASHADALERAIGRALDEAREQMRSRDPEVASGTPGYYLEVAFGADQQAIIDSLGNRPRGVEVVAAREDAGLGQASAVVFVPQQSESHFIDKVNQYRTNNTPTGRPKNENLVARIDTAHLATVRSLYTDDPTLYPVSGRQVWWEIWLRRGHRRELEQVARHLQIPLKSDALTFPEREVVIALTDEETLQRIMANTDLVAELRIAKDNPALFLDMSAAEQREWSDELLGRLEQAPESAPSVCILDSGMTREHPLVRPAIRDCDIHTYDPAWGEEDDGPRWGGHGTAMGGIALYGDLVPALTSNEPVVLTHHLESVKILPPVDRPPNEPDLYGVITREGVARAEVAAPFRQRAICMAVTGEVPAFGRPTSWSAEVDQICYGDGRGRLFIVSGGNTSQPPCRSAYLDRNDIESIQDPAQAWNALTVGGYTDKVNLVDPQFAGWTPIASAGDLSPNSRTSVGWDRRWPLKPDVVLEGGNVAASGDGPMDASSADELRLLSTHYRPADRLFTWFDGTSAASAAGARLAARVMAARPGLRPETVRGLIVHSAEWSPAMVGRMQQEVSGGTTLEEAKWRLLRRYGYGIPDLGRALLSAANDVTLIVEDDLQPFERDGGVSTKEMNIHQLPWPTAELQALGAEEVEMRVTLSYFIEPNPSTRGRSLRHRYASHGLRFAVKRATESLDEFRQRVNRAARDDEEGRPSGSAAGGDGWHLGRLRDRGSIHSDRWQGTAADLAQRDAVGVFPIGGWWKDKPFLNRWDTTAPYALIVTLKAPGASIDIYTSIAAAVPVSVPTPIVIAR